MKILIDDEKDVAPDGTVPDLIARNYEAGLRVLGNFTPEDEIYLDHDLGDKDETLNGYKLLSDLEEWLLNVPEARPAKIVCVSHNGPGRARIQQVIENLYKER